MARNKRKSIGDKEKLKNIRKQAKKRWRNKKAQEKALKNAVDPKPAINCKADFDDKKTQPIVDFQERKPDEKRKAEQNTSKRRSDFPKEISCREIVRSEKFLGCGTFGTCYLAHYRSIMVAVKEFKERSKSLNEIKREVLHEAKMISHLGDHRSLPLLFGVVTKSKPLRLITQFHGEKGQCLTLSTAMKKKKMDKPLWLGILKDISEGLHHVHTREILHNDLKANNIVLEKRGEGWNPIIIDFGKARFIYDPKPLM